MEGRLKQKLLGDNGILYWKSRVFLLRSRARALEITDELSSGYGVRSPSAGSGALHSGLRDDARGRMRVTQVSLEGARCAEPWSGINANSGCGFDLVWAGGRTWSLLCEDPLSRKSWVDALNSSIASADHAMEKYNGTASAKVADSRPHPNGAPSAWMEETGQNGTSRGASHAAPQPLVPSGYHDRNRPFDRDDDRTEVTAANPGRAKKAFERGAAGRSAWRRPTDTSSSEDGLAPPRDMTPDNSAGGSLSPGGGHHRHKPHHHLRRGPGRRRRRQQEAAPDDERRLDSQSSDNVEAGDGAFFGAMGGPGSSACTRGERERSVVAEGASSTDSSKFRSVGGGRTVTTRERSEELARASAATWEQFQQLLERSRASKARFDRAMGEAAISVSSGGSGAAGSGSCSPNRRCARARGEFPSKTRGSVVEASPADSEPVGSCRLSATAGRAMEKEAMAAGSSGGSSTDRTSDVTPPRSSRPRDTVRKNGEGGGRRVPNNLDASTPRKEDPQLTPCSKVPVSPGDGGGCATHSCPGADESARDASNVGVDGATDHDRSRLSACVTDVETSLLPEGGSSEDSAYEGCSGRSTAGANSTIGDTVMGSVELEGETQLLNQHRRRRRRSRFSCPSPSSPPFSSSLSSSKPPAPPTRRLQTTQTAASQTQAVDDDDDDDDVVVALTPCSSQEQRRLRVDRKTGRREAGVQTEHAEENEMLRKQLAELQAAVSRERERQREAAISRSLVERERDEAIAAAKEAGTAKANAEEAQGVGDARLAEALEEAREAERCRLEAVRQREELEKALAAEVGERRRVSELLEDCSRSERALQKRADVTMAEGDLKAKLASTRSELEAVCLERDSLAEELDQCISRLGDQARDVASALRSRQQREIAEISSRCEIEKEALREQLMLKAEENARENKRLALSDLERRIRGELAAKAAEEAERADKQLREAKAEAKAAGEATRRDMDKLRGLHARRVKRLEALLKEEGDNLADARREIAACKATLAGDAGEFQRWTEEQQHQSTKLLKELETIQKKVNRAVATEAEAREREGLAMNRLRKVMEEARLDRAEASEVKRQLREALAELEADRNTQARRARTNLQLQRAAEIAQQEVAMVEAERIRWYEERRSMEVALERLTRLVYGHGNVASDNMTNNDNHTGSKSVARNNSANCPWKPPGGAVAVAGRGHTGGAREPCSPMGVNTIRRRSSQSVHDVYSHAPPGMQGGKRGTRL